MTGVVWCAPDVLACAHLKFHNVWVVARLLENVYLTFHLHATARLRGTSIK